ncbi:MAG: hypothetical protein QME14_05400 [Methanobacteriaceae archaeon]|nr:hypothetical protein [Methanobacteriaceae archaeon]
MGKIRVNSDSIHSNHKVNSGFDNSIFVETRPYKKLCKLLSRLKSDKGIIVHVTGAPGTGKSSNIYSALIDLDINFYEPEFILYDKNANSRTVFENIFHYLKEDLGVNSHKELLEKLSEFDLVLFADKFHDSHLINKKLIGFSRWTDYKGFKSIYFYWLCIKEYLSHRREYNNINMVFQTAWRIYWGGEKYDLFTDLGIISLLLRKLLNLLFEVVNIQYNNEEIIKIIKAHDPQLDDIEIAYYIKKYGSKPRFILSQGRKDYHHKKG